MFSFTDRVEKNIKGDAFNVSFAQELNRDRKSIKTRRRKGSVSKNAASGEESDVSTYNFSSTWCFLKLLLFFFF